MKKTTNDQDLTGGSNITNKNDPFGTLNFIIIFCCFIQLCSSLTKKIKLIKIKEGQEWHQAESE
jgi:hypothetical protein